MSSDTEASTSAVKENSTLTKDACVQTENEDSNLRVSKDNMFMILALWMENFVEKAPDCKSKKVGAVLVLPNDIVWAADCSRDGVHAVARLLMKHHDKAKDCKMFMSRKPCRICAKLLVQSKVKRVLYLPREPEYYREYRSPEGEAQPNDKKRKKIDRSNKLHTKQVDHLFTTSAIAQTRFVLQVEQPVLGKAKSLTPIRDEELGLPGKLKKVLIGRFTFNESWFNAIKNELPWPEFHKIKDQVKDYFEEVMEWIARVLILSGGDKNARGPDFEFMDVQYSREPNSTDFNPVENTTHAEQAKHFIEMARFLAQRTDDPKTGVGAVVVSYPGMEIISIGWNGFPFEALYGEFPRASDTEDADKDSVHNANVDNANVNEDDADEDDSDEDDADEDDADEDDSDEDDADEDDGDEDDGDEDDGDEDDGNNKFPYVIHAEQNALMMRNTKNIKGAILFVTKSPCDECAPLIAMEGIETVVVDADVKFRRKKKMKKGLHVLGYNKFPKMLKKSRKDSEERKFICYQTKKDVDRSEDPDDIPPSKKTKLEYPAEQK